MKKMSRFTLIMAASLMSGGAAVCADPIAAKVKTSSGNEIIVTVPEVLEEMKGVNFSENAPQDK